ncbi:NADP-dependent oxidoreductase [Pseudonocardia ailaonensis]|uniref:NADP-dependent oxidoreductase n=1 Tax=Pseudonocardia ailaonensis TaxID=367279 RepID=A0ABN2MRW0_9PSEU
MRAIGVTGPGGPEVLEVVELPDPQAGPGQVRIRVHAAAVNPTDTLLRSLAERQRGEGPYVPGMDVGGVVDQVGAGVDHVAVGDAVMAIVVPLGSHGGYSSAVVVPSGSVVPAPADHALSATLPMNGLTARRALDLLDPPAGAVVGVTGAAGAFGGYVVQLAKAAGLRVVADASEADDSLVRDLGADVVVRRGDDVAERFREAGGVDVLADGSLQGDALLPAVRDGGRIATVRGHVGRDERGITWHPVVVRDIAEDRDRLDHLRELASAGAITLRVADTYPAERAAEAHARLEKGGVRGRLILTF